MLKSRGLLIPVDYDFEAVFIGGSLDSLLELIWPECFVGVSHSVKVGQFPAGEHFVGEVDAVHAGAMSSLIDLKFVMDVVVKVDFMVDAWFTTGTLDTRMTVHNGAVSHQLGSKAVTFLTRGVHHDEVRFIERFAGFEDSLNNGIVPPQADDLGASEVTKDTLEAFRTPIDHDDASGTHGAGALEGICALGTCSNEDDNAVFDAVIDPCNAFQAAGERLKLAGMSGAEGAREFDDRAEINKPLGKDGVGAGESRKFMTGGLSIGARGPIPGAVVAAIDTGTVSAGDIASEPDKVSGGEAGYSLTDRIHTGADLVQEDGRPLFDARQADLINNHIRLANTGAKDAQTDFAEVWFGHGFFNGVKFAARPVEVIDEIFHNGNFKLYEAFWRVGQG